jgi:predicted Rossmann fold nucleotide-binding protein DprA/Smf involved in DNA uptake
MNPISTHTQAVLLLTAYFTKVEKDANKPLTPTEWGRFALWLKEKNLEPSDLLNQHVGDLLDGFTDKTITVERIESLVGRGHSLAIAIDKWSRSGIWIITRSDAEYPKRLKQKLKLDSPALLFGIGNMKLLNKGGVSVVGSRDASPSDLDYTTALGHKVAQDGHNLVSGGARGVDETSMMAALEAGGTAVGVMADSLLKASISSKWRNALLKNDLALISPFNPEAGFNAGNAMARNKYIYCMSDAAVVVHSGKNGGTWTGALENLKKGWVPLWVKPTEDKNAGNELIVKNGGLWCNEDPEQMTIDDLLTVENIVQKSTEAIDLFSMTTDPIDSDAIIEADKVQIICDSDKVDEIIDENVSNEQNDKLSEEPSFYDLFIGKIENLCKSKAISEDELIQALQLEKSQLKVWVNKAIDSGIIKKIARPVRYELVKQRSLI